jgi:hypothetical protein
MDHCQECHCCGTEDGLIGCKECGICKDCLFEWNRCSICAKHKCGMEQCGIGGCSAKTCKDCVQTGHCAQPCDWCEEITMNKYNYDILLKAHDRLACFEEYIIREVLWGPYKHLIS